MKSKVYLYQLILLLVWIGVVVLLFKLISEKQIAAVIAGFGFILWPVLFLLYEWNQKPRNKIYIAILAIFIFANAIPIFLVRVLNWGDDFSTLSIAGIPALRFHAISNVLYLLVMTSCFFCFVKSKKAKKAL